MTTPHQPFQYSSSVHYLASPYTHSDPAMHDLRYYRVIQAVHMFLNEGIFVYSPIAMAHPIVCRFQLPGDHRFWLEFNHAFIDAMQSVFVLCVEGWRDSKGVQEEIAYAKSKSYPVRYWTATVGGMQDVTAVV